MKPQQHGTPDDAQWEASLIAMDTEALLATVRNYLGPIKTPYDKRTVVSKLAAYLRKPETRDAIMALLDLLDARILGTILIAGSLPEARLRDLFADELRAFDLGIRIANLQDRLLLFKVAGAREVQLAVNPLLAASLIPLVRNARVIMELDNDEEQAPGVLPEKRQALWAEPIGTDLVTAFFGLLHHFPGSLRKNGSLGKKAASRLADLLPGLALRPVVLDAMIRALHHAAALVYDDDGEGSLETDSAAYGELLAQWGSALPLRLAAALAVGAKNRDLVDRSGKSEALAAFLVSALSGIPQMARLTLPGLRRWLGIAAIRIGLDHDLVSSSSLADALVELGLLLPAGTNTFSPGFGERELARAGAASSDLASEGAKVPKFVADGSHLIRVLPEAESEDRWFAVLLAEPRVYGRVWELELDRSSIRRAFASGVTAGSILARLEALTAHPLPQSLVFSISSWENEYRSLRLYHGFVLVCDERRRVIIERSPSLADLVMERLAEGIYVLSARGMEEIRERLASAGIEAPPEIHSHPASGQTSPRELPHHAPGAAAAATEEEIVAIGEEAKRLLAELGGVETRATLDPLPRIEALRTLLASKSGAAPLRGPAGDLAKELADRVESRLIIDEEQLSRADINVERVEAGGLDYAGKARLVERAIRTAGDRLEMHYQLPGAAPAHALLRPVRLEKSERGLVLEAEDLDTGSPLRVPLGSASLVRRLRASPFGEER